MLSDGQSKAKALISDGRRAMSARNFDGALAAFRQAVLADPDNAEAQFHLGRLYLEAFRATEALDPFAKASELKPGEAVVWQARAEALALAGTKQLISAFQGDLKAAPIPAGLKVMLQDRFGARRKASKPKTGGAEKAAIAKLVSTLRAGKFSDAERGALRLLKQYPKSALTANILGDAREALGNATGAENAYRHAIKLDPLYAEAYDCLGRMMLNAGQLEQAANELRRAVILAPELVSALVTLGSALNRLGKHPAARPILERAVLLDQKDARAWAELGNARLKTGDDAGAYEAYLSSQRLSGNKLLPGLQVSLAQLHHKFNKDEEALEILDKALKDNPDFSSAISSKATLMQSQGRFEDANALYERALELDPTSGETYRVYLASRKIKPGDPMLDRMLTLWETDELTDYHRSHLGFAIAKALEEVGDDERVFAYLNEANALARKSMPYTLERAHHEARLLMAAYDGFDYRGATLPDRPEPAPIFVTGLPRSGTTLVEQIIASHSTMTSAGELGWASTEVLKLFAGTSEPRQLSAVESGELTALAEAYGKRQAERFPDARRITDKSITTYRHIGPLKLAMPNARFIVVRRDPRDNLFSIYKNKFPDGTHPYAYDMEDLAETYTGFLQVLDFWRERVPDWFYEVQYEDLVANPEEEARKLIEACGLEWEDQCLSFHENKNKVQTLSVYQVRQPISQKSVKGWKRFEKDLAPMIDALKKAGHVAD